MTSAKRISFLTTAINDGGAENQLIYLATRLKARGWETRVISMLPPRAYMEELSAMHIPVDSLGMRRGVADPRALFRLVALLRRSRPHIVHSHMVHANLLARLARPLHWVPVLISTAHNIDEGPDKRSTRQLRQTPSTPVAARSAAGSNWRERAYRLTDPLCDLTTNVSEAAVARYVRVGAVPQRKIRFVPNGVDTTLFKPDPDARLRLRRVLGLEGRFVWLAVGRFEEAKDHRTMIRAFATLSQAYPAALLLLVGQGSLEAEIKAQVVALGLVDRVRFLGVRRDIPALMNAADAYVMSSAWEGLPMVLLEASAVGLPIVTTDAGGNREVVVDGVTGFVVPTRDPGTLGRVMAQVLALPEAARAHIGTCGRAEVERQYSLERVVDRWEALYRELLGRRGVAASGHGRGVEEGQPR